MDQNWSKTVKNGRRKVVMLSKLVKINKMVEKIVENGPDIGKTTEMVSTRFMNGSVVY